MKEFEQVIGYEDVKREFEYVLDIMLNNEKYSKLGVKTPHGILLNGNPGVGKTLMASCFINASKRKCFTVRKDKPDGDFIKFIKQAFEEAVENQPAIVFLDDMDKFANEDAIHRNAEEYVTVQSCMDEVKDKEVFVLATANDIDNLPKSLLRVGRFDKVIEVRNPKGQDAIDIIKHYLSKIKFVDEVDAEYIAKVMNGRSCAELETVINGAGVYAGFSGKEKIDMDDIIKSCMRIIFNAPEMIDATDEDLELTAYHEAGHTVVAEVLEPDSVNIVSVLKYGGDIGGITSYYQPESYFKKNKYMENRVRSLLAGKAATEIVYGDVDVGANSDLHRAFDIVERFVDNYCSTSFDRWEQSRNTSNALLERREMQITSEMERYFSSSSNFNGKIVKQEQDQYARLWDEIQKELCNERLWSFITGGASIDIPTRIDFLIQLIVKINDGNYQGKGDHKFFSYFEEKLNESTDKKCYIEGVFAQLKDCFRTIQDWYNDYKLYNYIGYILTYVSKNKDVNTRVTKIIDLQNKYNVLSKLEFTNTLIDDIRTDFNKLTLDSVNYENNGKAVEKLLMLFNIEELNNIQMKFNFAIKDKSWSVEHIKAQQSEIANAADRAEYMRKEKESLDQKKNTTNDPILKQMIDNFIDSIDAYLNIPDPSENDFKQLAEQIDNKIDGFDEDTMHKLGNLALLPLSDNSSFSNNPFYEKRNMMNSWLQDPSKNIPYSTSRAFHKMYSKQIYTLDFTRWTKQDFDDMFAKQNELLKIDDQGIQHKGFIKEA